MYLHSFIIRNDTIVKLLSLKRKIKNRVGAQWLSGGVLDSRPRGSGFQPHQRHCVVFLSKTE